MESFDVDLKELEDLCAEMKSDESLEIETLEAETENNHDTNTTLLLNQETEIEKEEEICDKSDSVQPSAPLENVPKSNIFSFPIVTNENLYPDLKLVQQTSAVINEKILSPVEMKPFSLEQLETIYHNNEIKQVEIFEGEFNERELKDASLQDHYLYVLLKKYSRSRIRFLKNTNDAESAMKKLEQNYKAIWKIESKVASAHGFCACGRVLRATHNYDFAIFSEEINGEMEENMKKLQIFTSHNHVKFLQEAALYYRQIEQFINELMNDNVFKSITNNSPIALNDKIENSEMRIKVNELRTCVSVLFKFLREMPQDKKLEKDVKDWIRQLVSLQLRIATWEDHVFILFHILRCRDGVANWASCLIQIPSIENKLTKYEVLGSPDFHHCVAILHILLMPISKRLSFLEEYLKDVIASKTKSEKDLWILVDSDGEDGCSSSDDYSKLKENDLVVLFDQIPFELIFKTMCYAYTNGESYALDTEKISFGHYVIKAIAFSSKFICIIKNGLLSITDRHKQFAKRLGKLIKETLFYLSDIISMFKKSPSYKDPEESQRIQIEYDELIIRSACFIYESKKLSLFQYLADFPYELMSIKAVWKLYYCLHIGDFHELDEGMFENII